MMIAIDDQIKRAAPRLTLGIIKTYVEVEPSGEALSREMSTWVESCYAQCGQYDLGRIEEIKSLRMLYKKLGKDPSRYRGSAEAMLRRIGSGKGMYSINNVVDINNMLSIRSRHPVGVYNVKSLTGDMTFRSGMKGECYKGIGKDVINLEGLPLFADAIGPFGSPTSDSERAMIANGGYSIAMIIIASTGQDGLDETLTYGESLLSSYAKAVDFQTELVI